METNAEFYDHWNKYSSTTAKTVNTETWTTFGFSSISGSFSPEFKSVKRYQVQENCATTRVQIRHDFYKAEPQTDRTLHLAFKSHLLEIAFHLQENNIDYANYLGQQLVRNFGTHYTTSVRAGGALTKVDQLTNEFIENDNGEERKITAAASLSFLGLFGVKFSYGPAITKQDLEEYTRNTVHSIVSTFGGPNIGGVNFSISQWENRLQGELVVVDRSGNPLHFAVSPGSLPEISQELTLEVKNVVKRAITQYYRHNTIVGCTKKDSPNFSFQANLDDGSCEKKTMNNYTFGGIYQTCRSEGSPEGHPCEPLIQKNPLTSNYSCSDGFEPVLAHQGRTPESCHDECHRSWIFFKRCNKMCGYATYSTYWCAARDKVPPNKGYLFGGLYNQWVNNPVTQTRGCSLKFHPLRLGATMVVCVSDDYELGLEKSVPFGGFFSCSKGDPLSTGN